MNVLIPSLLSAGATYALTKKPVPSDQQILDLSNNWLRTVCGHNPQAVSNLYALDGILVGTVAQRIKVGRADIKTYFDTFLTKQDLCGEFDNHIIQSYEGWAINSGTYTFRWVEEGTQQEVAARFTFVFRNTPTGWLIANHHSSALPE